MAGVVGRDSLHGLGCLVEDADKLAGMLSDSGSVYVDLETSIADACGPR